MATKRVIIIGGESPAALEDRLRLQRVLKEFKTYPRPFPRADENGNTNFVCPRPEECNGHLHCPRGHRLKQIDELPTSLHMDGKSWPQCWEKQK